ncbi:MAG: hypothetical protein RLY16_1150 [Bacteroidota bacterium]|jgi:gliding motility-associated-like protein
MKAISTQSLLTVLLLFASLLFLSNVQASHISGGEMYYKYIGPGTAANTLRYEITLRLFRDCSAGGTSVAPMPSNVTISVFDNLNDSRFNDFSVARDFSMDQRLQKIDFSCIQFAPEVCYDVSYFHFQADLPRNARGYTASFQTCCRVGGINNIQYNFGSQNGAPGVTASCNISGTDLLGSTGINSSPIFRLKDTALVCANNFFTLDFGATDADFDSLSYSFCSGYGCSNAITNANDVPSGAPSGGFFPTLTYNSIYTGISPMGPTVTINPTTGIIQGNAPATSGRFVINVCINEYRNRIFIGSHRKDFILKVADCNKTTAQLNPQYFTCDGFTLNFSNNANNATGTAYEWTFGDPATGANNFSTSATPTHTFSDTGRYTIKLKVSVNGVCEDSTTALVKVYPGFFPNFNANPPFCKGIPVSFSDQTTTNYGVVNFWRWDFGNSTATNDTSRIRNPSYTYATSGPYRVSMIVGNSFGCIDTIYRDITIVDSPPLTVFPKDTTYCALDTLVLTAAGTGNFSWAPNNNILDANTNTPRVFPSTPTMYYVTLNQGGCIGRDSVMVRPMNNLTTNATASANPICEADTITLTATSNYTNGTTYSWTPTSTLQAANQAITKAFPAVNTNYIVTARWGRNCISTAQKAITVKPLAVPEAGPGGYICLRQGSLALQASGGDNYQWTPALGLSNTNIANPIATPTVTTTYKVAVGVNGCSAKRIDSVTVLVRQLPPTQLTNDTLICSIDTLRLTTSGVGTFQWSPNYMISSLTQPFPLVSPDVPTTYYLTLTDQFGCVSKDSVFVDVRLFVSIEAGRDTTICRTDAYQLQTISDAVSYQWSPALGLNSTTAKQPIATPLQASTTYHVIGNIGKCQSRDSVTIRTVPYPAVRANPDTTICFGSTASLYGTGASSYTWSPATYLTSTNTRNTFSVRPDSSILYTLTGTDTLGCPKAVSDTVRVNVYPKIIASTGMRDTTIVAGQPLQLFGSGGNVYSWSPARGLSDANIQAPVATPESDVEYKLLVTANPPGCTGRDSVKIKVYLLPPSLYVPTAFSPNGDGTNDILKPIPLGIKSIRHFRIYNRWGQLIFSTSQIGKGWDGRWKGNPQDPAAYVWEAEAITYTGAVIRKKGTVVLIR